MYVRKRKTYNKFINDIIKASETHHISESLQHSLRACLLHHKITIPTITPEFIAKLIDTDARWAEFIPIYLQDNKEIAMSTIINCADALSIIHHNLFNDDDIIEAALKYSHNALMFLPLEKLTKAQIIQALEINGTQYMNIYSKWNNDKEILLATLKSFSFAYRICGYELKNDRDVVLAAVKINGYLLKIIPSQFCKDKEIIYAALCENIDVAEFVSPDILDNIQLWKIIEMNNMERINCKYFA